MGTKNSDRKNCDEAQSKEKKLMSIKKKTITQLDRVNKQCWDRKTKNKKKQK